MKTKAEVQEAIKSMLNMRTILWEPMTDGIYGEFKTLNDAMQKYHITADDYFENRDGVLWIALND